MYFMICFLTYMIWAMKTMKIVTYWETKMLLLCHHIKFPQGCSVVSVRMWGVSLLDLSHSLWIVWKGSGENENPRPLVITNVNVLHVFPNFYDLSKEDNENCNIKKPKYFCLAIMLNLISAALLHLWECRG